MTTSSTTKDLAPEELARRLEAETDHLHEQLIDLGEAVTTLTGEYTACRGKLDAVLDAICEAFGRARVPVPAALLDAQRPALNVIDGGAR